MQSQEILQVVLDNDVHSETMIVEWADSRDGYGVEIIDDALNAFFKDMNKNESEEYKKQDRVKFDILVGAVRAFILMDMAVMGW